MQNATLRKEAKRKGVANDDGGRDPRERQKGRSFEAFVMSHSRGNRHGTKLALRSPVSGKPNEAPRGKVVAVFDQKPNQPTYSGLIQPDWRDSSETSSEHKVKGQGNVHWQHKPQAVRFFSERVVSSELKLQKGDLVQFVLFSDRGNHGRQKEGGKPQGPKASHVSVVKCHRSPEQLAEFVEERWCAINAVGKDAAHRHQLVMKLTESVAVWRCIFNADLPVDCIPALMRLITSLAGQAASLKQRSLAVIKELSESDFFNPHDGPFKNFLLTTYWYRHDSELQAVMTFLVTVARALRQNSRQLLPIVELLHDKRKRQLGDHLEQLMMNLLKVSA